MSARRPPIAQTCFTYVAAKLHCKYAVAHTALFSTRSSSGVFVNHGDTTRAGTTVAVIPPAGTTPANFDRFVLTVCPGTAITAGCPTVDCTPANASACPVTMPAPGQTYAVAAAAVKGGASTPVGTFDVVTLPA